MEVLATMTLPADDATEPRILLVEDEAPILDGLRALFSAQGFLPDCAADGPAALERLGSERYALVVLDLMIPGVGGMEVLRRLRARGDGTPVLILTARGAEDDVVAGLSAGADDYVTKPFGIRELVARAKALLRRPKADGEAPRSFMVGSAKIDLDLQVVRTKEVEVSLSSRETFLLDHLVRFAHRPVSREELLVEVWGYHDGTVRTRTVDVHIQQLRAKLREISGGEDWIETVRGRGYRFGGAIRR
jgi:DNA-binding response OmpR family regulator